MAVPRVPQAWIQAQAAAEGIKAEEALAYLEGGWMSPIWNLILGTLEKGSEGRDLIAATELRGELSLAADAMTDRSWRDGRPIVRAHFGLPAWAGELAQTITPFLVSPDNSRPLTLDAEGRLLPATPELDLAVVAKRLTYSLSWFASRAKHPYAVDETPLSPPQQEFATEAATAAMQFGLAHEMAHVRLRELWPEPNAEQSRAREFAADRWALERLIALDEQDSGWRLEATLPGVAIFLWASVFYEAFAGIEPTAEATHPPAIERIRALDTRLRALDAPLALQLYAGIAKVYGELMPHVQALAPDQFAPPGELRRLLGHAVPDEIPAEFAKDKLTWRFTYCFAVEGLLRYLAYSSSPVTKEQISPIESWLKEAPGLVIDALGAAYDGDLEETPESGFRSLDSVAREVTRLLESPYVREAIIPD